MIAAVMMLLTRLIDCLILEFIPDLQNARGSFGGKICQNHRAVEDKKIGCGRVIRQFCGRKRRQKDDHDKRQNRADRFHQTRPL